MKKIGTHLFLMDSGERFCVVLDKTTGVPFIILIYILLMNIEIVESLYRP